jgi:hypothetical protein
VTEVVAAWDSMVALVYQTAQRKAKNKDKSAKQKARILLAI